MGRTHEDIEDELLVLQAQEGDAEAIKTLVTRWHRRIVRLAWRLTAQRDAAGDIAQEAWLAIVRGLSGLDDPTRFRAWAYRIVANKCADWTRRRVSQRRVMSELRHDEIATAARQVTVSDSASDVARLRDVLAQLPQEQRVVLSLHYLDAMSVMQIADMLNVPNGTVKSRLHHARNSLKKALERIRT